MTGYTAWHCSFVHRHDESLHLNGRLQLGQASKARVLSDNFQEPSVRPMNISEFSHATKYASAISHPPGGEHIANTQYC